MKNNYFGGRVKRTASSERAEAMPAAIITAIVSSLLLLGIAGAVSLVVQNKADSEGNVALATVASNVDVSLRSDITQASYISASAKLKQPATRLLGPTDILLSGVNLHVPASSGECKVIRWNINGTTASRDLTIYQTSLKNDSAIKCDESSPVVAKRTKVFADKIDVKAPIKFNNQVGRELAFTVQSAALTTVNAELDRQLTTKGVQKLADSDFNELNKLMGTDSYSAGFHDPAACVMNAPKNESGVCPPAEADTVTAAWNSLKIAKVSVNFEIQNEAGEVAKRDIAQNSSVPLYADAAEAEASVADSTADNRPSTPLVNISTNRVILGANYTITWTNTAICPANMVRTFKVYENNALVSTQATSTLVKNYTNSATEFLNYVVQVECIRGALVVNSDMSAPATAKVIPAVPALTIDNQPNAVNAALNSNLAASAICLYGTTPRYNVRQIQSSFGPAGSVISNVASANLAINSAPFQIVQGARYQYKVEAWCISAFDQSNLNNRDTGVFTTVIASPAAPAIIAPAANALNVPTNVTVDWNPVVCAFGTTVKYYSAKNTEAGNPTAPQVIDSWTGNTALVSNNTQGNTVGYVVQALCEGTAVNSGPSPSSTIRYTTVINAPAATTFISPTDNATNVATNATVSWSAAVCAPATGVQYYTTKNMNAGVPTAPIVIDNWTPDVSLVTNNSEGNTVGYTVAARCSGPNASSTPSATDTLLYTTSVNAPSAPTFTAPANNATGVITNAAVTWSSVTCAAGTSPRYYSTKNVDAGAGIAPSIIDNWTTDVSHVSNNTQGNTVGYSVAARCEGPNASSASSATNVVRFTTLINAPAAPNFIAPTPSEGSVNQPTNSNLTWGAVACATGTTTQYYHTKDVNGGAAITPIVIHNWTTNLNYVTNALQGHTVRYTVAARCAGPNVSSSSTATDYRQYTTIVNAPSASWTFNDGWSTLSWNLPGTGCAPEATIHYRVHQVKADNNVVDARTGWMTGRTSWLPTYNTGGYPQWANIESLCAGVNAWSSVVTGNTTKWVKNFSVSFGAWQAWRRINVTASCPFATNVGDFHLYVAADGWGGARGVYGSIQTDEGAWIADAQAGGGGNTGWLYMRQNVNGGWDDVQYNGTTYNWGWGGNSGWGSHYSGQNMSGTYWNASGWGSWAYWWTGVCTSPYMHGYSKGGDWLGGGIRNAGDPGAHHNAWPNGNYLTQAGIDSIQ